LLYYKDLSLHFLDDSSAGGLQSSADVYEKVILKEGMNQTD